MSENKVTEDGLIEKALRVMGAEPVQGSYYMQRVKANTMIHTGGARVMLAKGHEYDKALFIHEAKLYLRELGFETFREGPGCDSDGHGRYAVDFSKGWYSKPHYVAEETEVEAYAQAVLAASGQEIGQAETQAPSTTSHQTETQPWRLGDYE